MYRMRGKNLGNSLLTWHRPIHTRCPLPVFFPI